MLNGSIARGAVFFHIMARYFENYCELFDLTPLYDTFLQAILNMNLKMTHNHLSKTTRKNQKLTVSMLGTLPPQKALSPYCLALVTALDPLVPVFFHSFSRLYPVRLHPSKETPEDTSFPKITARNLKVFTWLTWYNPFSWIKAGMTMKTKIFHVQWWSLPTLPAVISMILFARLKKIPVVVTVHNVNSHESSVLFD